MPALTGKQRKELIARSHALEPLATLSADELSDAAIAHVRAVMHGKPLVKIRLSAADREVFQAAAAQLAARTGSELVKTIGRIVLLAPPANAP